MPDARFAPEGTWRTGASFLRPYQAIWTGVTVYPWLEGGFRFTRIYHVPGFDRPGTDYGDYKDKSFDGKLGLLSERGWWPALAVGVHDVAGGTGVFSAQYAVASKKFGDLDFSLGYGRDRIDGAFGGVRWTPARFPAWSLLAEYDAFDYPNDLGAALSGADAYRKAAVFGIGYASEWYGAKLFSAHGHTGANVYVSVPLESREFVPKIHEPEPYTRINARPTEAQWRADPAHRGRLGRALAEQDFRNIELGYENGRLEARVSNARISSMPRAVGRAARTLLSFAPLEAREIRVTYLQGPLPVATYTFIDARLLGRYFNGMASRELLAPYVAIEYAKPDAGKETDKDEALAAFEDPLPSGIVVARDSPDVVALRGENLLGGRLYIRPGLSAFLNDPAGAFKFDLGLFASYDRALGRRTFLVAETRLTLYEDVSDVTQPSNSELPHVRSDVAEYKKGADFKLNRLLVNRFFHPAERVYGRASAGIYEEMYSGAGGQALYLGQGGDWAVDFDANWLRQRDFDGVGYRDYSTVTAIASLNYRMAKGTTATLRAGRFLAKDEGVRAEVKRRFASGFEVGAWYTVTNANDTMSPASPESPYRDKGIFMLLSFDAMMTRDTTATGSIALSPWTRDVGQMVQSPGDLYRLLERPTVQMHARDGLVRFGDREDDYHLPSLGGERRWPDFVGDDLFGTRQAAGEIGWTQAILTGAAMVLSSAALDKPAFEAAARNADADWLKNTVKLGNALPVAALGLSGVFAFDESRPRLSDTGVAALEAGALTLVSTEMLKWGVGRARPTEGRGRSEFDPGSRREGDKSFPSRHTALMWAAVTPYAKEFGMEWLYGVAALTNVARTGSGEHWFSDGVGGSLLGYAMGHLAWEGRRQARRWKSAPSVAVAPGSVGLRWELP
jgi:membrane-associated phospholipid phosphatase